MIINFCELQDFSSPKLKQNILITLISTQEAGNNQDQSNILQAKENYSFTGKLGQMALLSSKEFALELLVGVGEKEKFNNLAAQKLGGKIISYLNSSKIKNIALISFYSQQNLSGTMEGQHLQLDELIVNLAFGGGMQNYRFNKYFQNKKEGKEPTVSSLNLLCSDSKKCHEHFSALQLIIDNVSFARNLVSEPGNVLNPESYAEICHGLTSYGLEVRILDKEEMTELGMNSLLAVGQGSNKESKTIIIKWQGADDKNQPPLAFVGKGVTFDSGGISIKPSQNMEDMKTDMAGSAVVVSLMKLLAQRKAKINAVGAIGLVENMPSGTAQRPGDVVKSMSGQTIEVVNTDAEGRMVLADVLHYVNSKFKPNLIIDLATLTGAIVVALADVYAGLFSNSDQLANELEQAGKKTGEQVWQLPLGEEYDEMINSDIADMKNVGSGRGAGSITAAQFLKRFVGETKWAHLDIAGVAWRGKGDALATKGATGFGLRLLNQFIIDNYENH